MRVIQGKAFHPYEYRFFEGGGFPETLEHDGAVCRLKTSFRVWLRFDQLIQAGERRVTDEERLLVAARLTVKSVDPGFDPAVLQSGLAWFHGADANDRSWQFDLPGKQNHKDQYRKLLAEAKKKNPGLSLFWDAALIWGGFKAAFGIDLYTADLHWWGFLALMNELPENCSLNRLIRQRTMDVMKEVDVKERDEYTIRQRLAAAPGGGILEGDGSHASI